MTAAETWTASDAWFVATLATVGRPASLRVDSGPGAGRRRMSPLSGVVARSLTT